MAADDDEVVSHVKQICTELNAEHGHRMPKVMEDAIGSAIGIVIVIFTDMVRITCVVHEQLERNYEVAQVLLNEKNLLFKFLNGKGSALINNFPKILHEVVILARDETEIQLGVRERK